MGNILLGLFIPFIGTCLGSAMVYFMKDKLNRKLEKFLLGFASGVMIAASIWSLILPSIDMSSSMGKYAFIPAAVGFLLGIGFLLLLDVITPHLHLHEDKMEGPTNNKNIQKSSMLMLAVTLHNIPESMAVGVVLAGILTGSEGITIAGALTLSIGIALQNFPEGAVISMPLKTHGFSKNKAFAYGALSGIVEPIFALLTLFLTKLVVPVLPYFLSFAAGAMVYVVVEELIPETVDKEEGHSNIATIGFALGFVLMMVLDIVFA